MTLIFGILFTISGLITFRGADEQSPRLVRLSGLFLASVLSLRFVLLGFSLMINETLPEATFLYVYRTSSIPILFTLLIYVFYGAMLFCYYNELAEGDAPTTATMAMRRARAGRKAGDPYTYPYQVTPFEVGLGCRSPLQLQLHPQPHSQQQQSESRRPQNLHLQTLLQ